MTKFYLIDAANNAGGIHNEFWSDVERDADLQNNKERKAIAFYLHEHGESDYVVTEELKNEIEQYVTSLPSWKCRGINDAVTGRRDPWFPITFDELAPNFTSRTIEGIDGRTVTLDLFELNKLLRTLETLDADDQYVWLCDDDRWFPHTAFVGTPSGLTKCFRELGWHTSREVLEAAQIACVKVPVEDVWQVISDMFVW